MVGEEQKGQGEDETSVVELDRRAWNLPRPLVQPVGPVRDVWPVRPVPSRGDENSVFEDLPAA